MVQPWREFYQSRLDKRLELPSLLRTTTFPTLTLLQARLQLNMPHKALNNFQNVLNRFLNGYMDGSLLSKRGILGYPFVDEYSSKTTEYIKKIAASLKSISENSNNRYDGTSRSLRAIAQTEAYNSRRIAHIISGLYSILEAQLPSPRTESKLEISAQKTFDPSEFVRKDPRYLKPVNSMVKSICNRCGDDILSFHLHGSLSTLDFAKGFSDVDTFVIIKKETIFSPDKLYSFRNCMLNSLRYFYMLDPLQHHGHKLVTEVDMAHYPQVYFPFVLFGYSTKIVGNDTLVFFERNCEAEIEQMFIGMCSTEQTTLNSSDPSHNLYTLKYFLSILQLLPTIYLQYMGQPVYKKFSFAKIKPLLTGDTWKFIKRVSTTRLNWHYPHSPMVRLLAYSTPSPFVSPLFYRRRDGSLLSSVRKMLGDTYLDDARRFKQEFLCLIGRNA